MALLCASLIAVWLLGADWQVLLLLRWIAPGAVAATEGLAAIGVSSLLHALLRRLLPGRDPDLPTHLVVGLPLYGTLVYLVASFGTGMVPMTVALVVPALAGAVACALRGVRLPSFAATGMTGAVACALLGVVLAVGLLWATLPPATIDEVAYHLAVPKSWVIDGRVTELPLLGHSYFPFGIESAHLPALALLGDVGALSAHLVHLGLSLAVLAGVVRWMAARASTGSALLAAAAIATAPALITSAGLAWNEWPTLGLALALFFSLEASIRREGAESPATAALALAGGLSTKYTFIPFAAAALLGAAFLLRKDRPRLRTLGLVVLCGGALGSGFFLRNLVWTGNPIAPFLQALAPAVGHFNSAGGPGEMLRRYVYDPNMIDESIGATLFMPALIAVALLPWLARERIARVMTAALAGAALLAFATGPSARLVVPLLAPLALMGMVALEPLPLRGMVHALLLVAAALQVAEGAFFLNTYAPMALLQKGPGGGPQLSGKSFLAQRTENFHPAIDWIDARLPPGSRVLVLGLHRLYWFSRSARGGGNFDGPRVAAYLDAASAAQLRERFRRDGITHVAIFKTLLQVSEQPAREGYKIESRTVLTPRLVALLHETLDGGARTIGSDKLVELYQLE